jgi:hypothetical protein
MIRTSSTVVSVSRISEIVAESVFPIFRRLFPPLGDSEASGDFDSARAEFRGFPCGFCFSSFGGTRFINRFRVGSDP